MKRKIGFEFWLRQQSKISLQHEKIRSTNSFFNWQSEGGRQGQLLGFKWPDAAWPEELKNEKIHKQLSISR